jgi:hypothetical protein
MDDDDGCTVGWTALRFKDERVGLTDTRAAVAAAKDDDDADSTNGVDKNFVAP